MTTRPNWKPSLLEVAAGLALAAGILLLAIYDANAGQVYSSRCDFDRRAVNCTTIFGSVDAGPRIITVPADDADEERAARIRKWEAFCQPKAVADRYGTERLVYAHPGCEFGRSE